MKIHQVKTRYSNTYIAEEADRLLVIDVAARCDGWVVRFIEEELARPISDVELVVCTHDDQDHIGGIHALARAAGANVGIPYASRRPHLKLLNNPLGPIFKIGTSFREAFRRRSRDMYANAERNQRYKFIQNHHLNKD